VKTIRICRLLTCRLLRGLLRVASSLLLFLLLFFLLFLFFLGA
jgi:hypothetical protein